MAVAYAASALFVSFLYPLGSHAYIKILQYNAAARREKNNPTKLSPLTVYALVAMLKADAIQRHDEWVLSNWGSARPLCTRPITSESYIVGELNRAKRTTLQKNNPTKLSPPTVYALLATLIVDAIQGENR
jgi:hypothetical protein